MGASRNKATTANTARPTSANTLLLNRQNPRSRNCGDVSTGDYHQEHRENLAIAEVHLENSAHHDSDNRRDPSLQQEPLIAPSRRQSLQRAIEVMEDLQQHPDHHQQCGNASLRRVLEIE